MNKWTRKRTNQILRRDMEFLASQTETGTLTQDRPLQVILGGEDSAEGFEYRPKVLGSNLTALELKRLDMAVLALVDYILSVSEVNEIKPDKKQEKS